jgi:hypothetical protein
LVFYYFICLHVCIKRSPLNRYADPDAEHREDYDGPPVKERAERRFQKKFAASASRYTFVDGVEVEAQEVTLAGEIVAQDLTPTEVEPSHLALREGLVRNFDVLWKKRQVHWLKYPPQTKRDS